MTVKRISFALAAATLLFVGAGCTAGQQLSTGTTPEAQPGSAKVNQNVNATVKVEVPTTIDSSVDAILNDAGAEIDVQKGIEDDAADVNSDTVSAKAFGTASYDSATQ